MPNYGRFVNVTFFLKKNKIYIHISLAKYLSSCVFGFLITFYLFFQLLRITFDEDINRGKFGYDPSPAYSASFVRPWSTTVDPTWRAYCYSSSESFIISPETLWEVCHWITYVICTFVHIWRAIFLASIKSLDLVCGFMTIQSFFRVANIQQCWAFPFC